MSGALDDITVLELANWAAGPSAGALMADMGAQVIKVEPLTGDPMRNRLPQPVGGPPADHPFHVDNRGKRSIAIALDDARGAELLRELSTRTDVVITNLLPRRAVRYGLDPETLCARNPRLVYALLTAYGSNGEEGGRVGFDQTAYFCRAGITGLLGEPDAPPITTRAGQGDHPTGLALLVAILAALRERDRTGLGQVVETALVRMGVWTIAHDIQTALVDGRQPVKRTRTDAYGPMTTTYRCGDGRWLNMCGQDQGKWATLCKELGRPELADHPRFATPEGRFANNREIIGILDDIFASAPSDHWSAVLDRTGIAWERVAELPEVVSDPQLRAIAAFVEMDHPTGPFDIVAAPFTMSSSDVRVRRCAPSLGEHTDEVLRELGIDSGQIADLAAQGVVGIG